MARYSWQQDWGVAKPKQCMLEKLGIANFWNLPEISFFENQDQRRAAAHSGTKAAEAEAAAKAKAASWLNWFGQNRFQKYCGSFIQTQIQGPI